MSMLKQQMAPVQVVEECAAGFDQGRLRLAGLYLLTDRGQIARFDAEGDPAVDDVLTEALSFRLQSVLHQYRSGSVEELSLGLIADADFGPEWRTDTLIFSDRVLNDLFDTGRPADVPLTIYEQRNKTRTVFQGLELLLNKSAPLQPMVPRFCPVLFVPEVDIETLHDRYGVDFALDRELFEVLDLCAPFASNNRRPRELLSIVQNMRQTQRDAVSSGLPGTPASEPVAEPAFDAAGSGIGEAEAAPRDPALGVLEPPHDSCFNEGDAVTGWLLEWFVPFNELTDTQREIVAGYEIIRTTNSGTCLIEQGSRDDICIYLVEGSLALEGPDGATMIIKAGTRRSRLPISVLTPHVYNVTAITDATFIALSQKLVRRVTEITTTYTSVGPRQEPEASTAAISNETQALYLSPAYSRRAVDSKSG